MSEALRLFTEVVLPVALIALTGYLYSGWRTVELKTLTELLLYLCVPCLVLHGMTSRALSVGELWRIPLAVTLAVVVHWAIAGACFGLLARRSGQSLRGLVLPVLFPNAGNMGLPVCALFFGEQRGLPLALVVFATLSLLTFSLGIGLARGGRAGWTEPLRLPLLYAMALGVGLQLGGQELPLPLAYPVEIVGKASVPLMLFVLGCQLRQTRVAGVGTAAVAVVLRMAVGPLLALGAAQLLGIGGMAAKVMIVQLAMPPAVLSAVLAQRYEANPAEVSTAVLIGTLLSAAWIPFVLTQLG